jgi:hypothetical protein
LGVPALAAQNITLHQIGQLHVLHKSMGAAVAADEAARVAMRADLSALTKIDGYWEGVDDSSSL